MKNKKLWILLMDMGLVVLVLFAGMLSRWMIAALPPCPFVAAGLLCPACGGTRCVRYITQGAIGEAFAVNPFIFLLIIYVGIGLILLNIGVWAKAQRVEKIACAMLGWQAVIVCAVLFVLFGVARNVLG